MYDFALSNGTDFLDESLLSASYADMDAMSLSMVTKPELRGEPLTMDELLEQYKEEDPGVFSVGGTFGIDSEAFGLEVSNVYVSVVDITDNAGANNGKLVVVQGMAFSTSPSSSRPRPPSSARMSQMA